MKDKRQWFVMPPTEKGAWPDIYAADPTGNEQHEQLRTAKTIRHANRIVEKHNKSLTNTHTP